MAKMSELDLTVKELRNAAASIAAAADGLVALFSGTTGSEAKVPTPPAESAPKQKPIALEDIRAVLAEKSRAGHTAEVRELLLKHGANKLSEIDPAEYPSLMKDAEVLGNG